MESQVIPEDPTCCLVSAKGELGRDNWHTSLSQRIQLKLAPVRKMQVLGARDHDAQLEASAEKPPPNDGSTQARVGGMGMI